MVPKRKVFARKKRINLALQGGGAHGAFTWGVLDALLERDRFDFEGVSGTSAGAVNAVALASGLIENGAEGARQCLHDIWSAVSRSASPAAHPESPLSQSPAIAVAGAALQSGLEQLVGNFSPYALNPLNINPLKRILRERIDFEAIRKRSPLELFVAATEVSSGKSRIFEASEMSVDAVLASACLPTFFPAVSIDDVHYWDGGYSANPDLRSLILKTGGDDTLLIQINPDIDPDLPISAEKINAAINRLTFSRPLKTQLTEIGLYRQLPAVASLVSRTIRRMRRHRFHLIDGSGHLSTLQVSSKVRPNWPMIVDLRDTGRQMAHAWLKSAADNIGHRSSSDIAALYPGNQSPFD